MVTSFDTRLLPYVLSSQKVLSGSGRAGRLRIMGKYIDHRLVARSEPDNTFWDDSMLASEIVSLAGVS